MNRARIGNTRKKLNHLLTSKTAQQVSEYAILIALVIAAVFAMRVYVQRGLQAKYHAASLGFVTELRRIKGNNAIPLQYEPYYQKSQFEVTEASNQEARIAISHVNHVMVIPGTPALVRGKEDMATQSSTERRGSQKTLSGNYGD